jgi:hypothetical protein
MDERLRRPHRPHLPVAIEELFWGDAGIGMSIMGSAWPPPASAATARPSR